jgi:predicted negative regulator of RcsB-dependent stress response
LAEKKLTRKELLKEPDEFLTTTGEVFRFVRANPKTIVFGCLVVVACALAVAGYFAYQKYGNQTSHELFEKDYQEYQALEHSAQTPTDEQWDQLAAKFATLAKEYPSFPAGEMALLYEGHVLYKKKDFKGALDRYTRMQSTNLIKSGLGPLVLYHIAMTRMAMNDYEQAAVILEQLSQDTNSPYRREAYVAVARIYESMGKNKEAVQAYRQYLKMFPEAPDASFVKARIAELSVQG